MEEGTREVVMDGGRYEITERRMGWGGFGKQWRGRKTRKKGTG